MVSRGRTQFAPTVRAVPSVKNEAVDFGEKYGIIEVIDTRAVDKI